MIDYDSENPTKSRPVGKLLRARTNTSVESLRSGWAEWLTRLQYAEFGTLTLAPAHGKNCRGRECNGLNRRGSIGCRVPGVQKTQNLVSTFAKLCSRSFIVEEFAPITGRRHFHYLADDSQTDRYEEQHCLREMAGRQHQSHDTGWTAVGFWRRFGGQVAVETINSTKLSIEYVLKDLIADRENRMWIGGVQV